MGPGVPFTESAAYASSLAHSINYNNSSVHRDSDYPVVAHSIAVMSQFPPPRLARELIVLYLTKVNRFMPLIPAVFLDEYDAGIPQSPFLLLAIFTIASKYSSDILCRSDPMRAQTAGENYCKAACRLVDEFLDIPRLSTVHGLFLLGKYLEESKNRSLWTKSIAYVAMAIRMAMEMGLNRNCSGWGLDPIQVEYRNRTWWYFYVYDRRQGACYGRPLMIQDQDCAADLPKHDPSLAAWAAARNPAQDKIDVEYFLNLIHLSTLLGRVMNTFYPANTAGMLFHGSSRNTNAAGGQRVLVDDMFAQQQQQQQQHQGPASGSRKRSKTTTVTTSRSSKSKPLDSLEESEWTSHMGEVSSSTTASASASSGGSNRIPGSPYPHHQDMLMRQYLANQKHDTIVAELNKDLTEWVQGLPPHFQWINLQTTPNVFGVCELEN
ncbi:hypothetical protein BGZ65_009237 [Modicella reniformis]|uniref:Xylanolytic transcriptional activator regulatory domain-containing protein n=1 Tax=Modicella reniformis TaxID=1440133 RepID=A0A9P6MAY7_9FUNG|nr:hypothetical protein BGZ65_009237 [Modicella reniformis]